MRKKYFFQPVRGGDRPHRPPLWIRHWEDESRSRRYELISTDFELDILVKNSQKSRCDQIRRSLWDAQAIASPPSCLSFIPFHRNSCFSCPQRFSTNDGQWKHKCSGASGSQYRFRHFGPLNHVTLLQGAARSILCWRQSPGMGWIRSTYVTERKPTRSIKDQQSRPHKFNCGAPQGSVLGSQKCIAYTKDLAEVIDDYCLNHHVYADDTHMIEQTTIHNDETSKKHRRNSGMVQIFNWIWLQLNPAKTELIWFGSKANLKKMADLDLNLYIGADVIKSVRIVRDLGVFLDSELAMRQHINRFNAVVRSCFFIFGPKSCFTYPRLRPGVSLRDNQAWIL